CSSRRRVPHALLQIRQRRSGTRSQRLTGMPQVVEGDLQTDLLPCAHEGLIERIATHRLAVATHEEALGTGPLLHVLDQVRLDVRRIRDLPTSCIGLRVLVELPRTL